MCQDRKLTILVLDKCLALQNGQENVVVQALLEDGVETHGKIAHLIIFQPEDKSEPAYKATGFNNVAYKGGRYYYWYHLLREADERPGEGECRKMVK